MGRYYHSNEGREGKFALCSQSSTDPGDFFGLEEQEPTEIEYYAGSSQEEDIKKKVNELYDKLGVPEDKRIFYFNIVHEGGEPNQMETWYEMVEQYAYIKINRAEIKRYEKLRGEKIDQYYCDDKHKTLIEKFKGANLCMARIKLGVVILSDIKDTGECWITADLG